MFIRPLYCSLYLYSFLAISLDFLQEDHEYRRGSGASSVAWSTRRPVVPLASRRPTFVTGRPSAASAHVFYVAFVLDVLVPMPTWGVRDVPRGLRRDGASQSAMWLCGYESSRRRRFDYDHDYDYKPSVLNSSSPSSIPATVLLFQPCLCHGRWSSGNNKLKQTLTNSGVGPRGRPRRRKRPPGMRVPTRQGSPG